MMSLSGTFQIINWQESIEQQFNDGAKLSIALVQQTYSGDMMGNSTVRYQLYYNKSGDALFQGFETISYQYQQETAQLTIKHDGKFEQGTACSTFMVVDSSHDSQLTGRTGSFTSLEGGQARYQIL